MFDVILLLLLFFKPVEDLEIPQGKWISTDVPEETQQGISKGSREITMLNQPSHEISRKKVEFQEAERRRQEAEKKCREAEGRLQEAERRRQEAEKKSREAERSRQDALKRSQRLVSMVREIEQDCLVNSREIDMTDQLLGEGGWGEVKIAYFRGLKVAAKVHYKVFQSLQYNRTFIREMYIKSRLRHPNLVQFIGASIDEKEIVIMMELMHTSMRKYLVKDPDIPSAVFRVCVSLDIAKALNYLHLMQPHPIIHRNISSANVLLEPLSNQIWRAKVTDYGSANLHSQMISENPGIFVYSAPEAHLPSHQSIKMDIFSFGVLLIEMNTTARFPDVDKRESLIHSIKEGHWVDMIQQCIHQDQAQRPVMSTIITQLTSWQET